jgi:hypothetical protein
VSAPKQVETTVFLTLEPMWSRYSSPPACSGFKIKSMTVKRPLQASGPVIELKLRLPAATFEPLRPTVIIEVPPEAIDFTPVVSVELPAVVPVEDTKP